MSGSFSSGGYGRESSSYGGSDRYGGGGQNRAGSDRGQGGRGGGGLGPSSVGAELSTRERNLRDIENLAAGRPSAIAGASGRPSAGGGTGQGGRGGTTLVGNDTTANYQAAKKAGVSPDQYNKEVTDYAGRIRDSLDSDNTLGEDLGNLFAGFLGFNEQPVEDLDFDPQNPTGPRSGWGFDPVGAIASIGGMLGGLPFGPGFIADQISAQLGRPLEIGLGPDVFGSDTLDENGQVVGSSKTHTGGSVTVRDSDNPNEFFGVSPGLGILGQGAANTAPRKQTYTGADPAPVDEETEAPYQPVTPQPSPIDTPPAGGSFDAGNSGLTSQQLSDLFVGYMNPGRTARGRSSARVVV